MCKDRKYKVCMVCGEKVGLCQQIEFEDRTRTMWRIIHNFERKCFFAVTHFLDKKCPVKQYSNRFKTFEWYMEVAVLASKPMHYAAIPM